MIAKQRRPRKGTRASLPRPIRVTLESEDRIVVLFSDSPVDTPDPDAFSFDPPVKIERTVREGRRRVRLIGEPVDMRRSYRMTCADGTTLPLLPNGILDRYVTDLPLGLHWHDHLAEIRLFHPRGRSVRLCVYENPDRDPVADLALDYDKYNGCWSIFTADVHPGQLYGFKVEGPDDAGDLSDIVFCDPYGPLVAKSPGWPTRMLSVVPDPSLLQSKNGHVTIPPRDLIIYEAHVKDVSMLDDTVPEHQRGTYAGATAGRFSKHVQRQGVNAVEWLPLHIYDDREPPYSGPDNNWNPTARNHWGYMSAQFFAPEPRYAKGANPNQWMGVDGAALHELRQLVSHFHERGIAVFNDVVFNHVGTYGQSPLRRLDPGYWLRLNGDGSFRSDSWCGNDFASERPMARRMIVDSLLHWSRVYGIDGFRFDLAGVIDETTLDAITEAMRNENPGVHLIAEPWGRVYDKHRFNVRGWSSWNDEFRDGILGHHPVKHKGHLFTGEKRDLLVLSTGWLKNRDGAYTREDQAVNYLASHDNYCYGDFLRIASGLIHPDKSVHRLNVHDLTPEIMLRHRLGMFLLMTSRGIVMLAQGDDWARAKIIADHYVNAAMKEQAGLLDRDSYNKDDSTNWLNWADAENEPNSTLIDYTAALAALRKKHPALRLARWSNTHPLVHEAHCFAYELEVADDHVVVMANMHPAEEVNVTLPEGVWAVVADETHASSEPIGHALEGTIVLPPLSARLLVPRR